ncbi:MAG TPA: hypothetical protein P5279_04845 [Anaerohalosphaeraceae bacterium]|jgi:hypothetical protein|nr:hypothetical protein [Anaerohalosphaeraceae bacterium]
MTRVLEVVAGLMTGEAITKNTLKEESTMRNGLIISAMFVFLGVCGFGRTFNVALDGSGDFTTIQAAVDAAADGDEVVVADGTYTGAGNRDIDFRGKEITVRSANGPEHCIIDCQNAPGHRGFYMSSEQGFAAIICGFTIRGGLIEAPRARGGGWTAVTFSGLVT